MNASLYYRPISLLDNLGFDIEFEALQYLKVTDLPSLASTNNFHNSVVKNAELWRYFYERDFKTSLPSSPSLSPQHLYYIRSMSGFMNADREKSINNMLNAIQTARNHGNPFQRSFVVGIWKIDFDRNPGYTYLEDDRGLGIELAFTSNGWFRFRSYDGDQLCVYSSSEVVNQSLHVTELIQPRVYYPFAKKTTYEWGEWTIAYDIGCIYIMNNTDQHQALLLSPFEYGFAFFPTDKNPSSMNNIITYPEKSFHVC